MKKTGIIGGTFNPIHTGHLIIANIFAEELDLDMCYFVPAFVSPFKTVNNSVSNIDAKHRLEMVRLAIKGNERFSTDDFEISQDKVSYTINTVKYFKNKFPESELYLLIGLDQLLKFNEWRDYTEILSLARLCVALRSENKIDIEFKTILKQLTIGDKKPVIISSPLIEISSTIIRERISSGLSIKYLVPKEVEKYIIANKLYT